jgi:hypothetical protein
MADDNKAEVHKTAGIFKDIIEVELVESQSKGNTQKLGIIEGSKLGTQHADKLLEAMDRFSKVFDKSLGVSVIMKGVPKEEMERKFISAFQSDYTEEFGKQYKLIIKGERLGVKGEIELNPNNSPTLTNAFEEAAKIGNELKQKYDLSKQAEISAGIYRPNEYEISDVRAQIEKKMRRTLAQGIDKIRSR